MGDLLGHSSVLAIVLSIALVGSILSATATQIKWIITGRAMLVTTGAVLPLCFGLVREHLPAEKLPVGLPAASAIANLGATGGFLIAGVIGDNWHCQHILTISKVLAGVALMLSLLGGADRGL